MAIIDYAVLVLCPLIVKKEGDVFLVGLGCNGIVNVSSSIRT